jgi:hypothetical protein
MTRVEHTVRRAEAVRLLREVAALQTDPGGRGYALGMADRIAENRDEVVMQDLADLRAAIEKRSAS